MTDKPMTVEEIIEECDYMIEEDEKSLKFIGEDINHSHTRNMLLGRICAYNHIIKFIAEGEGA